MRKSILLSILIVSLLMLGGCIGLPFRIGPWELAIFIFFIPGIALYFLPTIIAAARHKRSMLGIVLLNVLAGWSLIGWIIALVWAFSYEK